MPSNNVLNIRVSLASDCTELYRTGVRSTGIYRIQPRGSPAFIVYCDMTDGGWTVFMRRFNGSQNFNLEYNQYKKGFGKVTGEHWVGNDKLYFITNQKLYRMRMDATIWSTGEKKYSVYDKFRVDNEGNNYRLHVSGYTGNLDRDNWVYHNGMEFLTRDRDNDRRGAASCSQTFKGGHWYNDCYRINPTGLFKNTGIDSMNLNDNGRSKHVKEMTLKIKSV